MSVATDKQPISAMSYLYFIVAITFHFKSIPFVNSSTLLVYSNLSSIRIVSFHSSMPTWFIFFLRLVHTLLSYIFQHFSYYVQPYQQYHINFCNCHIITYDVVLNSFDVPHFPLNFDFFVIFREKILIVSLLLIKDLNFPLLSKTSH